ncbi:MAG: fibronectin type III domain-containing protein [Gammaproteobacteria bacterium]|jgi:hypothetical protein
MRTRFASILLTCVAAILAGAAYAWSPTPVSEDPLVRMPGTQPDQGVNLESPNRCLNCHAGYNQSVEPGFNWMGSMMAQSARDPIFWACLTVAAQDSIWALGNPNAVDLCERCHFPGGWLAGRSDPPNASLMTGSDYDGLHCDFCHTMWDPFFEDTYAGAREGSDWTGYWDETTTLSQTEALKTVEEDRAISQAISLFNGQPFYGSTNRPFSGNYTESASGQYFISPNSQKRASFADAGAKHQMLYSRFHKSKYFCATCHDVSNPALANLGLDPSLPLRTETDSAHTYFHVERTFSEFILSDYGQPGGAPTNADFRAQGAPDITHAAKCQDCHMRDVTGAAANKGSAVVRPDGSTEHPASGMPLHDLTGGNAWISYILASLDPNVPEYDSFNADLLNQGPSILTLDLSAGQTPVANGAALKAGSDRAKQQLLLAATIKDLSYDAATGALSFKVQNNTGHKLISGFPEGRRMFVNIKAYQDGNLIYEVNPYETAAGTLKGLDYPYDGEGKVPNPTPLTTKEARVDELVYEVHPSSDLTGETETFHFVLATGRYKDNRIPPRGFDIDNAPARMSEPVWHGASDPNYFTTDEYTGGYDAQSLTLPAGADTIEVTLYYQGTSREYIEFLRDEIKGKGDLTLPDPVPTTPEENEAYLIQTDPFFSQLAAWGDTIWQLWEHNHQAGVEGITPFAMAQAAWGAPTTCDAVTPQLLSAEPVNNLEIAVTWGAVTPAPTGYRLYYDQAGKAQLIVEDPTATSYTDTGLTGGQEYCYKVTSYTDCESGYSNILCATATQPITVCADILDKASCNNEPTCEWQGSPKSGSCVEVSACEPVTEGPVGDATCSDGLDNDCDTLIDGDDPDCQAPSVCDNDGVCDVDEDCLSCASDCAGVTSGKPADRFCCGNGIVESAEGDGAICDGNF